MRSWYGIQNYQQWLSVSCRKCIEKVRIKKPAKTIAGFFVVSKRLRIQGHYSANFNSQLLPDIAVPLTYVLH
jgi:hypothetical protein